MLSLDAMQVLLAQVVELEQGNDRLRTTVTHLEQENGTLRAELQSCQRSHTSAQIALDSECIDWSKQAQQLKIAREQKQAAQQRAAELAKANEALQATIDAMAAIDDLDEFVPAVLRIVAQTFQAKDCAFYEHSADEIVYLRYWLFENRVLIPEEVLALDSDRFAMVQRLADGFTVPDTHLGTPVRERTRAVILDHRVKTSVPEFHAFACRNGWHLELNVPLVVDGYADGALVIYRPAEKPFTPGEVALAESLGKQLALAMQANRLATEGKSKAVETALAKLNEVIAREQEKATQERVAELAKANDALKRSLSRLAEEPELNSFLGHVLLEIVQQVGAASGYIFLYDSDTNTLKLSRSVTNGQIQDQALPDQPKLFQSAFPADLSPAFEYLCRARTVLLLNDPHHLERLAWTETLEWHRLQGHTEAAALALMAGDQPLGMLGLPFRDKPTLRAEDIELIQALAQQATLAIQLTRLAEKAKQAALAKLNEVTAREQEQAAQERAAELGTINEELKQRDRLLSVVAQITKDLLEVEEIDLAIPAALQAVGEVAEISRVLLLIESQDPDTQTLHHHIVYEWVAEGVQRSLGLVVTNNATFHRLIEALYQGQSWWGMVADLPDVTRLEFEALDILSTGVVPIFFEGRYIGCVAFDDCVNARQWNQQEIDVLTAAAESMGAALHRKQLVDRLIEEQIQAEQERAAELVKANLALQNCVDRLAGQLNPKSFIDHVLLESVAQVNAHAAGLFLYNDAETQSMQSFVKDGQVQPIATHPDLALFRTPVPRDPISIWDYALARNEAVFFNLNNERVCSRFQWHRSQGHRSIVRVPLLLGTRLLGFIGFCFQEPRSHLPANISLVMTLAQQVTVALHLAQLAEQNRQAILIEERNRIAREIHDTLAQTFTGISIQLNNAQHLAHQAPEIAWSMVEQVQTLAHQGLNEARRSVWALQPDADEYRDLAGSLQRSLDQLTTGTALQADLLIVGAPFNVPADIGMNLLRIAQESITNTLRHAHAQTLLIELSFASDAIVLQVQDDGQGFAPDLHRNNGGFGLVGMQQRCDRLNGQFSLLSQPGQGTTIFVQIPLPDS